MSLRNYLSSSSPLSSNFARYGSGSSIRWHGNHFHSHSGHMNYSSSGTAMHGPRSHGSGRYNGGPSMTQRFIFPSDLL